jgi:[protein-PII] uridylyltransferase
VIEIETEDRVGLLYSISEQLSELALDISGAKISTERGAAIDSFYVREFDGTKVVAQERQRAIQARLRSAITELERR